jgi:hypothetical protein
VTGDRAIGRRSPSLRQGAGRGEPRGHCCAHSLHWSRSFARAPFRRRRAVRMDIKADPGRSMGKMQLVAGSLRETCTGGLAGVRTVATAAHCLINIRTSAYFRPSSVIFLPGASSSGALRPSGCGDKRKRLGAVGSRTVTSCRPCTGERSSPPGVSKAGMDCGWDKCCRITLGQGGSGGAGADPAGNM